MKKSKSSTSHEGWEKYYRQSETSAWKDETEAFLLENLEIVKPHEAEAPILDVASGDGRNAFIWLKTGHAVCCNDISATALQRLGKKVVGKSVVLLCGDFLKTELLPSQFGVVQCFDGVPQMPDVQSAIQKMVDLTKPGGSIIFNLFTPQDVAFGEGEQVDANTWIFKDTLFSFFNREDVEKLIPQNVNLIKCELKKWDDPPHGDFRPYTHTHEAFFIILKKQS